MSEPSDDRAERLLQEIHDALVIRKKTGDEHAPTRVVAASLREAFNAGRSSRDAEVAALELRASTAERRERERVGLIAAVAAGLKTYEDLTQLRDLLAACRALTELSSPSAHEPKRCERCDGHGNIRVEAGPVSGLSEVFQCPMCNGSGLSPAPGEKKEA
jgi:hypothetical protein